MTTVKKGPRKVIIGTSLLPFYGEYPGLDSRLKVLSQAVGNMSKSAQKKYKRRLDIAVLPECAVTYGMPGDSSTSSLPLEGKILDFMSDLAKKYDTYVTIPMSRLQIKKGKKVYTNIVALVDRTGNLTGIYEKVHLVSALKYSKLEGGKTAGKSFPVFDCDFGKVGFQICYDMSYDDGWAKLKKNGAEIVIWPTMSPQTTRPMAYALRHNYYVVSSTPRENASIFEPTGIISHQTNKPNSIVVAEIDLDYAIVPWSVPLRNGKTLTEKYGKNVGYNYYPAEDLGLFWSNDPKTPISKMLKSINVLERDEDVARNLKIQQAAKKLKK